MREFIFTTCGGPLGYFKNVNALICPHGFRRYVSVPNSINQIVVSFSKRARPESFKTTVFGELEDHPRLQLMLSFKRLLRRHHAAGYKFFRIEY